MTVKFRLLAGAAGLVAALPASAQTAVQPVARGGDDATVTALIRLLVGRGTISQTDADALVDAARSQAAPPAVTQAAAPAPPPAAVPAVTPPVQTAGAAQGLRQEAPGTSNPSVAAPAPASSAVLVKAAGGNGLTVDWSEGAPKFVSPGGFTFRPRGRVLVDAQTTSGSRYGDRNIATTGTRALRLGVEGTYGPNVFYQFEADFADAGTEVTSAYFGWRQKLSSGITTEVNFGSRLTERGIDGSTGSDQTPFLERNAVGVGLIPLKGFFGLGITSKTFGPNWHFTALFVGEAINGASDSNDTWTAQFRGHWNPIKTKDGLIHLGGWGYHENFSEAIGSLTLNTREANRYNDNIRVFAGRLGAPDHSNAFGLEAGGTYRGLWAFGEYGQRNITFRAATGLPRSDLKAWSISTGLMLTGEKAPFAPRGGTFTLPEVVRPITAGGWGGLEVLLRYEETDYSDTPLGGTGNALTGGINWYLNDIARVMFNWIHFKTDNRTGDFAGPDTGDTLATRVQISF